MEWRGMGRRLLYGMGGGAYHIFITVLFPCNKSYYESYCNWVTYCYITFDGILSMCNLFTDF